MELKIEQRTLSKLLSRTVPACAAKSPMAALTHVLMRAEKSGEIVAMGTDLVLSVTATDQCEVKKPGALTVSARQLSDVVRLLKPGELTLSAKDGRLEVKAGKSKHKVPCASAEDFPKIPTPVASASRLRLPSRELARLLAQTMYARSHDENRAFLACVRLEQAGKTTRCVAMDSKRLALASGQPDDAAAGDWGGEQINARALDSIKNLCESFDEDIVSVSTHGGLEGYMHFEWPGVLLSSKSAGSNFIPYQKLIPAEYKRVAAVGREDAIEALKRAALIADKAEGKVRCELNSGTFAISCQAGSGEALEELEADYAGDAMVFGINAACFIDALKTMPDDTVLLQLNGPKDPLVIVGEHDSSCTALIMFSDL
jgi:DNA polymerase-3 subunit beta